MIFASINSDGFGEADSIVLFTVLPPLGWTRYSDLDNIYAMGVNFLGPVPSDNDLMEFKYSGRPLVELGDDSPVYQAVAQMMESIFS